jgi:hypothetical protein
MTRHPNLRWCLHPAAVGLLLAVVAATLCRVFAGVSLGLFIGPFAFTTLIVPPLAVVEEKQVAAQWLVPLAVCVGSAVVWLSALGQLLTFSQWVACCVALLAYAGALCGVASLLVTPRVNPFLAAGLVTVLGLLWLTWPVWLSPQLLKPGGDELVSWLVPAHPLFGVNGVLLHLGTWDRHDIAYEKLTVLNQDMFYALPRGVLRTTLAHALVAALALSGEILLLRRRRPAVSLEVDVPDRSPGQPRENAVG